MQSARRCVEEANVSIPFEQVFPGAAAGRYALQLGGFEEAGVGFEDICSNAADITLDG